MEGGRYEGYSVKESVREGTRRSRCCEKEELGHMVLMIVTSRNDLIPWEVRKLERKKPWMIVKHSHIWR